MSAHFDGGAEIVGRRLREVEVMYVDDPTLNLDGEESDDCPASPPPTYYLRVREEEPERQGNKNTTGVVEHIDGGDGVAEVLEQEVGDAGGRLEKNRKKNKGWSWRYVNVEKKKLLVWDRRGGRLLRSIPLRNVELLRVIPDQDAPASILEVYTSALGAAPVEALPPAPSPNTPKQERNGGVAITEGDDLRIETRSILVLQARSRQETMLWAKVLQENVELMTKRLVPLENLDDETNLSDVQQLAKLLTHQLSELQDAQKCSSVNPQVQEAQSQNGQFPPSPPSSAQDEHFPASTTTREAVGLLEKPGLSSSAAEDASTD